MRRWILGSSALLVGVMMFLIGAELILRFFPVATGMRTLEVTAENPLFRFTPNREFVFSSDALFSLSNRGWVNNDGFVNDQDYRLDDTPLLAIIGDSYVEAAMIPYAETFHGRLAKAIEGRGRVYSFGASGAPLSQYLIFARHARQTWRADAMVITVVGNDFDESLARYRIGPGFFHYVEDMQQGLKLQLFEYRRNQIASAFLNSVLFRYALFNLKAPHALSTASQRLAALLRMTGGDQGSAAYVGNVPRQISDARFELSTRAVTAFFRDLPAYVDLPPERILFLVDGFRYRPTSVDAAAANEASYFGRMRLYFMEQARLRGYSVIDADAPLFTYADHHPGVRYEFPHDGHWNALGHEIVAKAIIDSPFFAHALKP